MPCPHLLRRAAIKTKAQVWSPRTASGLEKKQAAFYIAGCPNGANVVWHKTPNSCAVPNVIMKSTHCLIVSVKNSSSTITVNHRE